MRGVSNKCIALFHLPIANKGEAWYHKAIDRKPREEKRMKKAWIEFGFVVAYIIFIVLCDLDIILPNYRESYVPWYFSAGILLVLAGADLYIKWRKQRSEM